MDVTVAHFQSLRAYIYFIIIILVIQMMMIDFFTATFVHRIDETTLRCAHAEIRTRVAVICGPTRYRQATEAPSCYSEAVVGHKYNQHQQTGPQMCIR